MKIIKTEAIADLGKWISRKGQYNYFKACTLLIGETEKNFEEITDEEYQKIKAEAEAKYALPQDS